MTHKVSLRLLKISFGLLLKPEAEIESGSFIWNFMLSRLGSGRVASARSVRRLQHVLFGHFTRTVQAGLSGILECKSIF